MVELVRLRSALPSFARQTGQPCGTCHTDFPALTPYGRRFKLLGYTVGGGKFRTTPFPAADDARSAADKLRNFAKGTDSGKDETDKAWVPPIADDGHCRIYPYASVRELGLPVGLIEHMQTAPAPLDLDEDPDPYGMDADAAKDVTDV